MSESFTGKVYHQRRDFLNESSPSSISTHCELFDDGYAFAGRIEICLTTAQKGSTVLDAQIMAESKEEWTDGTIAMLDEIELLTEHLADLKKAVLKMNRHVLTKFS